MMSSFEDGGYVLGDNPSTPDDYVLADGTLATNYDSDQMYMIVEDDLYKTELDDGSKNIRTYGFAKGSIVVMVKNDGTNCPEFKLVFGDTLGPQDRDSTLRWVYWSDLIPYNLNKTGEN